ncbi:hypothetical protein EZ428_02775 [Pedobacter frigiditerrae]|uniref:Uncharacterized protein n=1 Tax=Pedobacter frigiditerrae TaxID=2530452 RepID=A0A4R0N551_9SPHI|nr:hypothetical protein [Pedobacter frigiditerrae]TCC93712.1 hypothetical protein EZ428_02775 [Pedobacter frigiditerrae]
MKSRVILIVFIGLFLSINNANAQSVNNSTVEKVSVVGPPPEVPTCLSQFNSRMEMTYNLWILMIAVCDVTFPSDPAGLTECKILADDTNTAMLMADLSAFNRCNDKASE